MFILNENKKNLDKNIRINKAMVSMNTHNLASSSGKSGDGKGFLILGELNEVPCIYVVISFEHTNDVYEPEDIFSSEKDIHDTWQKAIVFLENLGFYLDDIDVVSVREDFRLFELKDVIEQKDSKVFYNDKETNAIIDYLVSY